MADDESNVNRSFKEIAFKVPWGVITGKAWGPDDGKPFLGLHGWIDNANTFDRYTFNIPSLPPPGSLGIKTLEDWLVQIPSPQDICLASFNNN